jgi:hypothetical protein
MSDTPMPPQISNQNRGSWLDTRDRERSMRMARATTVIPRTSLGKALERYRLAKKISRKQAYEKARTSDVQWTRLLTEDRKFEPNLVKRAALAVGLPVEEAFLLARIAVVPNGTSRVITKREFEELLTAS